METERFPNASKPQYRKVGTGEKGFLGFEKKQKVQSGNKVDNLFLEMTENYYVAYSHFFRLICEIDSEGKDMGHLT